MAEEAPFTEESPGAYDSEEVAARTYDLAALQYWGPKTILNFSKERYEKGMAEMKSVTNEEYLASLRRRSSGFSRGVSKYRGVARHHQNGRWEARIGRVFGNKYLYLGTFDTQEEAAAAYDMAALEHRGTNAVTNFDVSRYVDRLKQKGIFIVDRRQKRIPDSDEAQRAESIEKERLQLTPQQELKLEESEKSQHFRYMQMQLPMCIDCPTTLAGIEPTDSNELAWSFCMDSELTSFLVPDIPLDRNDELSDLFDHDTGFEDNFDLIFDVGSPNKEEANQKCISDDAIDIGASINMEDGNGKER